MSKVSQEDKDQLRYDMMRDDYEDSQHEIAMRRDHEIAIKHLKSSGDIIPPLPDFRDLCNIYDLDFKEYLDSMIEEL